MARTDNLTNFLTDVADAIRTKEGTSGIIQASDFDTRIQNLPSGATVTTLYPVNFAYTSSLIITCNISSLYPNYSELTMDNIICMPYGFYPATTGSRTLTWTYNSNTGVITSTASAALFASNITTRDWKIVIIK